MKCLKALALMLVVFIVWVSATSFLFPSRTILADEAEETNSEEVTESLVVNEAMDTSSDVPINSTTFPDEAFRNVVSEEFDIDGNGFLSMRERLEVTDIIVSDMNIADLKGIEYFPYLGTLFCSYNRLTSLDLSMLPNIYILICFENDISVLNLTNTYAGQHFEECVLTQSDGLNIYESSVCRILTDYGVTIRTDSGTHRDDAPANINMYRLYNTNSGEHFYTASADERDFLVSLGWRDEGIGWVAPAVSNTPVYRLYNENGGEHHYTTSVAERNMLVSCGWNDEGIGWYSDDAHTVPLYRQYNPNAFANNHNYTTSLGENDWLVSIGWRSEGIGWYGVG